MKELFVKICGITRPQDAALAAGLGASALGFVFWPSSPRKVSVETAKAIAADIPAGVLKVGVFVNQPVEDVARIMDDVGLDVAQLHGHESPEYCQSLGRTIFKAVGMADNGSVSIEDFGSDVVLLVDAYDAAAFRRHG